MKRNMKRNILVTGLLAALLYAGYGEKKEVKKDLPSVLDYSSYSQFDRKPEKVVHTGFDIVLFHDFDGDGTWDAREFHGFTPGAYVAEMTEKAALYQKKIKIVDKIDDIVQE